MHDQGDNTVPKTGRPSHSDPEWELVTRIGAGDRAAFEQLYKQYFQYLYRFILQTTRRHELVEDVINEVMLAVWQQAAAAQPWSRTSTWILGIAHHKALQALTRSGIRAEGAHEPSDDPSDDPRAAFEANDLFAQALRRLAPEQRAVMELVYYHELHYDEIAQVLGVPANTVKTRVFHARRKLREHWPALNGHLDLQGKRYADE